MASFDVIVVGGGSAGCALAGRLSQDSGRTVCLVEAGPPDNDPRIRIPLGVMTLMGSERYDWRFRSTPHEHLGGRVVSVPRGRTLGGSGSINSMVYIRGRASDYDRWAELGCTGWGWTEVLERYKRAEQNSRGASEFHGGAGPLFVEDLPSPHSMVERFVRAGAEAGVPANDDFNGAVQEGLGTYQVTMHDGRRWSPADAYLRPAMSRSNLTVMTGTEIDRIEFDGHRATGVHTVDGRLIEATGEVVLAAGAIASPAILLRSGIGPGDHLAEHGIDCILDQPAVGANLHDHPAIGMHYGGGRHGYALSLATLPGNALAPLRYLLAHKGLFASNTVEAGGFARTRADLDEPDVQFHFIPARLGHEGSAVVWGRGYYSDVCLLKPKSRGRLSLASSDPRKAPAIDLNLLADPDDDATMLAGAKLLRRILASPQLKTSNARELVPGPDIDTDGELRELIHERLGTAYHPVGTCRMGPADHPDSVVDPRLNLIGIENVRVADASIMPEVIAGNTNAASMMIGEAGAEFIAEDARG
jgi:choline dehydrogenase-like flavoprotein